MDISPRITEFLTRCIDSVEQLRVLLLLHENPSRVWSAGELSAELRSSVASISKRLDNLYVHGVLSREGKPADGHRFVPTDETHRELVDEVARLHGLRPYTVIDIIYSKPPEALQEFADAFRIRRKD